VMPDATMFFGIDPEKAFGTDPNAAMGFIRRRYDLSATGLSSDDLRGALRPLLTRSLLRDVRFRLREVVRLRGDAAAPPGDLPALLAAYPDPDAAATPVVPLESFAAIDAALVALLPAPPSVPGAAAPPTDVYDCGLKCHSAILLWDVREGRNHIDRRLATLDVSKLSEGLALNLVGILVKNRFYADNNIDRATQQCIEGFGALDLPQEIAGYKPRPLAGVWATPPFLHNGSVPSLTALLLPPDQRPKDFWRGCDIYDPVAVGFRATPPDDDCPRAFHFDTALRGEGNGGHTYGTDLPPADKAALIEYLKTL